MLTKKWCCRIGGGLLAVFGLIFGSNLGAARYGLGDEIFRFFGLSPWSNGDMGIHYTAFCGIFMICIGLYILGQGLEKQKRQWVWPGFILFWILLGAISHKFL